MDTRDDCSANGQGSDEVIVPRQEVEDFKRTLKYYADACERDRIATEEMTKKNEKKIAEFKKQSADK